MLGSVTLYSVQLFASLVLMKGKTACSILLCCHSTHLPHPPLLLNLTLFTLSQLVSKLGRPWPPTVTTNPLQCRIHPPPLLQRLNGYSAQFTLILYTHINDSKSCSIKQFCTPHVYCISWCLLCPSLLFLFIIPFAVSRHQLASHLCMFGVVILPTHRYQYT